MKKTVRPKVAKTKSLDPDLLGPCMIYCGYCGVYLNGKCGGCGPMSRKRALEGKVFCPQYACAKERGVVMCAKCADYPCKRFDVGDEDAPIFSKEFTEYIRSETR